MSSFNRTSTDTSIITLRWLRNMSQREIGSGDTHEIVSNINYESIVSILEQFGNTFHKSYSNINIKRLLAEHCTLDKSKLPSINKSKVPPVNKISSVVTTCNGVIKPTRKSLLITIPKTVDKNLMKSMKKTRRGVRGGLLVKSRIHPKKHIDQLQPQCVDICTTNIGNFFVSYGL